MNWFMLGAGVTWNPYANRLSAELKSKNKRAISDFYADWRSPCRELDEVTFRHPDVVKQAESHFTMIKVDDTRAGDPINAQLLKQYDVKGEYATEEYFGLDLPVAPAVMVADEILVEGSDISQEKMESAICRHLGITKPEETKKGILECLLNGK